MNKSLIAVLLLGLIVVAMAAEVKDRAKSAKMEELRKRKAKIMAKEMAKKGKMHMDKVKKGMRDMPFGRKPDSLAEKQAVKAMKEQVRSGLMTKEEYMHRIREEFKRGQPEEKKAKKTSASRSKRSTKEAFRKVSKDAVKMTEKKRRSPNV